MFFCAQRQFERRIHCKTRRILRIVFLLFANYCLKLRNKKSIEGARRHISGSSNQIAPSGPTSRIFQSDRSFRTNKSGQTNQIFITDLLSVQTNQIYPTDLLFVQTNQIFPTDLLSVQTNQIFPTDLLSVQTNQISPTDLLPYHPIRSLLRTYFRTDQLDLSYGPIFRTSQSDRSDGPTFCTSNLIGSYGE